jgi:hypothetical protein
VEELKPLEQAKGDRPEDLVGLNPFELLKREAENRRLRYEEEIRQMLDELNERKEAIGQWEREKEVV